MRASWLGMWRVGWGATRLILHILLGLSIVATWFPFASAAGRTRLIRWWAGIMLRICGIRLRVSGAVPPDAATGRMLVLNHISWIDIYVLNAVHVARFVAKSEIRGWPVIGYLCDRTGTIFIERGRRRAVHQANLHVADILRAGGQVGVFPEGTTSDGMSLLPFHANLIQAALEAGAPVQPVALRYVRPDGTPSSAAAYIGEMTLVESFHALLVGAPLVAELHFLAPIETATAGLTRHMISAAARAAIAARLGFSTACGIADIAPETGPGLQDELL